MVGQQVTSNRTVLECRVGRCLAMSSAVPAAAQGVVRYAVNCRLAHEPFGWLPTTLLIRVCRYPCPTCVQIWRQDASKAVEPRAKLSRAALTWALNELVVQLLTVARLRDALGAAWNTVNDAVLAEGRRVLISDPARFDGVSVIGVNEQCGGTPSRATSTSPSSST